MNLFEQMSINKTVEKVAHTMPYTVTKKNNIDPTEWL
jgi:hypothetical protein